MAIRRLLVVGAATALALTVGACGGGDTVDPAPAATGTFVGQVADPEVFVAVVARPAAGATEREVRVLVYGDRTNGIEDLFEGAAVGNDLDLASETGATLKGAVAPDAATGTVVLADGMTFDFRATPATGPAGWYGIPRLADTVSGTSTEGGTLEGSFSPQLAGEGMYTLTATVTPPGGQPMTFTKPFLVPAGSPATESVSFAVIIAQDGELRGGAMQRKTGSGGSGFTDLMIC